MCRAAAASCAVRPAEGQLGVPDRAEAERRLAVGEVEDPRPLEAAVIAKLAHLIYFADERLPPALERLGVARADLLDLVDHQARRARRGCRESAERGDQAAGEDVALDPVGALAIAI